MSTHLSKREFRGNTQLIVCVFVVFVGIKRETNLSKRDVRGNTQLIVCVFVILLLILRERERERERERGPLYVHIVLAMETYIVDNQKIAKIGGVSNCHHVKPSPLPSTRPPAIVIYCQNRYQYRYFKQQNWF